MMVMLNLNLSELTSPSALPAFFSISSSFTVCKQNLSEKWKSESESMQSKL